MIFEVLCHQITCNLLASTKIKYCAKREEIEFCCFPGTKVEREIKGTFYTCEINMILRKKQGVIFWLKGSTQQKDYIVEVS